MVVHPINWVERLTGARRAERAKGEARERRAEKRDTLSLSEEAKSAAPLIRFAKTATERASDIRSAKLAQVRERLSSGFYLRRRVIEKIAENIARALGL